MTIWGVVLVYKSACRTPRIAPKNPKNSTTDSGYFLLFCAHGRFSLVCEIFTSFQVDFFLMNENRKFFYLDDTERHGCTLASWNIVLFRPAEFLVVLAQCVCTISRQPSWGNVVDWLLYAQPQKPREHPPPIALFNSYFADFLGPW